MARLTKQDLATLLKQSGTFSTKKEALAAIETLSATITSVLSNGDSLAIPGFGKFEPFKIKNGSVKPKFRPYKDLKSAVSGAAA